MPTYFAYLLELQIRNGVYQDMIKLFPERERVDSGERSKKSKAKNLK